VKKPRSLVVDPNKREHDRLKDLALAFNGGQLVTFPRRLADAHTQAWKQAESIIRHGVEAKNAHQVATRFNAWARQATACPSVSVLADEAVGETFGFLASCAIEAPDMAEKEVIWTLWRNYFDNPERRRLKLCPQCGVWFVDETCPGTMVRCSTSCTNKWWTVERRKAAGHRLHARATRTRRVTP
jgi:hypothetical protein